MLDLDQIQEKLSTYLSGKDEIEFLHRALKKQNSHLIFFDGSGEGIKNYCAKHRLDPQLTIICADVADKAALYRYLYESGLRNYLILQKDSQAANYTNLSLLIYVQRQKFSFSPTDFDPINTFSTEAIEDLFRARRVSPIIQKNFSIVFNELVMNAIIHGETPVPKLSFTTFSDYLIFRIQDFKGGFDFDQLKKVFNPDLKEVNPAERRTAGIGLNIVFKYSCAIVYEVSPSSSTVATFFLNLNRSQRDCSFIFCQSV